MGVVFVHERYVFLMGYMLLSLVVIFFSMCGVFCPWASLFCPEVASCLCPGGAILEHIWQSVLSKKKDTQKEKMPLFFLSRGIFHK